MFINIHVKHLFLERFLGDQRASYNQDFEFRLRLSENGPAASVEDIILESNKLRVSQTIIGQGNESPSTAVSYYFCYFNLFKDFFQFLFSFFLFIFILRKLRINFECTNTQILVGNQGSHQKISWVYYQILPLLEFEGPTHPEVCFNFILFTLWNLVQVYLFQFILFIYQFIFFCNWITNDEWMTKLICGCSKHIRIIYLKWIEKKNSKLKLEKLTLQCKVHYCLLSHYTCNLLNLDRQFIERSWWKD